MQNTKKFKAGVNMGNFELKVRKGQIKLKKIVKKYKNETKEN